MNEAACHIRTDLGRVRLIGEGEPMVWSCAPAGAPASESAESLRQRAAEAAAWVAQHSGPRRRLSLLCVDVDESVCVWLRTPSSETPVLAAALRNSAQDWGDRFIAGSVQRLARPAAPAPRTEANGAAMIEALRARLSRKKPDETPVGAPVIGMPDSLARLWLDDLDARAVRIDSVVSLWHALALAWSGHAAEPADPTAVVLIDGEERIVWAWARNGDLLAGGHLTLDRHAEPSAEPRADGETDRLDRAAMRLALDWLSWATHLGATPAEIVLLGADAPAFAEKIKGRWPECPIRAEPATNPIDRTITLAAERLASQRAEPEDPLRLLTMLSRRPTRAVRTQYRWAAAAILLLAAALGGLGYRFRQSASLLDAARAQAGEEASRLVAGLNEPSVAGARDVVRALESVLLKLRQREPPRLPPAPRPIQSELARLTEILSRFEGVRLVQVNIDNRTNSTVQVTVPNRRTSEEILVALNANPGAMSWALAAGAGVETQLRLNGTWIGR